MASECELDRRSVEYARITLGSRNAYVMRTERITIGRGGGDVVVDIDVGPHAFVSRKHLEVSYAYQRLKVRCLGKNGIFIDDAFKAHSPVPYELPYECTLRFPSTNVQVGVQQLVGRRVASEQQQTTTTNNKSLFLRLPMTSSSRKRKALQQGEPPPLEDCIGPTKIEPTVRSSNRDLVLASPLISSSLADRHNSHNHHINNHHNQNNQQPPTTRVRSVHIEKISPLPQILRALPYGGDCYSQTGSGRIIGPVLDSRDLSVDYGTDTQKPPYSYAQLIVQAVSSARDRQLTLSGIYGYITKHYPYFKAHDKGWQNSVRHNLSLNRYFIKVPRGQDEPGKGSFWRIDGAYEGKLTAQAFRKRRLRNGGGSSGLVTTGDHGATAARIFSVSAGMGSGSVTNGDHRSSGSRLYAVRRGGCGEHKGQLGQTTTTFVIKKVVDTGGSNGGSNVFNQRPTVGAGRRVLQQQISVGGTSTGALISICGRLYAANRLKSIQVVPSSSSGQSVAQHKLTTVSSSKYVLISSSSSSATSLVANGNGRIITADDDDDDGGLGIPQSVTATIRRSSSSNYIQHINLHEDQPHSPPTDDADRLVLSAADPQLHSDFSSDQPLSPMSASDFPLDDSTDAAAVLKFAPGHAAADLDLEMEQLLDNSYGMLGGVGVPGDGRGHHMDDDDDIDEEDELEDDDDLLRDVAEGDWRDQLCIHDVEM